MNDSVSNEHGRPVLICPRFRVVSEAWMTRQFIGLADMRPLVMTWKDECEPATCGDDATVSLAPTSKVTSAAKRSLRSARNLFKGRGLFGGDEREARWIEDYLALHRPSVALCHYGMIATRLYPILSRHRIPMVVHFNGLDLSMLLRRRSYRHRLQWILPRVAGLIVVADYMRHWVVDHGADPGKVHLIPYGSPIDELTISTHVADPICRFLMVGRLTEKKRPDISIEAFADVVDAGHPAELIVIGDGDDLWRRRCQEIIDARGVGDHVQMKGAIPNDRVRFEMSRASVFIQHSMTASDGDSEGWPVSIAEAAGSGLPIVSTRHAGIVDQVDEGRSGYLVDENDRFAMADRMIELASDPKKRTAFGASAHAKMSKIQTSHQIRKLERVLRTYRSAPYAELAIGDLLLASTTNPGLVG